MRAAPERVANNPSGLPLPAVPPASLTHTAPHKGGSVCFTAHIFYDDLFGHRGAGLVDFYLINNDRN